jgi:PadR family transcriptional regulator, regulatory protein PadR
MAGLQGTLRHMEPGQARNVVSQLRRGTVEYCVLALLHGQEHYGFELVRKLSDVDGLVTSEGTIYPLLTRLRRDELVKTSWRESETGPPRRYYSLTAAGQTALADFTKEWARFRDAVDALLKLSPGASLRSQRPREAPPLMKEEGDDGRANSSTDR